MTIHREVRRGATLLVISDASLPVVRFMIGTRHGAILDPEGQSGRGRVMLELLSRGTQAQTRAQWNAALERLGSQVGASLGSEFAFVRGITLERHLETTLRLVHEAMLSPKLADTERDDFVAELVEMLRAERDDDDSLAEIFMRRALYAGHPLWRSAAGEPEDLERLDARAIKNAYDEHFSTGELVIVVAGDIHPDKAHTLFAPLIDALPERPPLQRTPPPMDGPRGVRIVVVDKPERTQVQLRLGCLTLPGSAPDLTAFWLGAAAFGGTFTSPFTRAVRDERGWSYSAYAEFARRRLWRTPLVLKSAPAVGDALDCLELELELYRNLAQGELADEPIELARAYLLNRYPFEIASAADLLLPAFKNELLGLPLDELFTTPQKLEKLNTADVRTALQKHLSPADVAVVMVATASDVVPELRRRLPDAQVDVVGFNADFEE